MQSTSTTERGVLHKGVVMVEIPMIPTKEDSTQRVEETRPISSPIIREEVDNALCARLMGKCILGDAGLDSRVVIGVVDQDTSLRIAGPLPIIQPIRIAQGNNRILGLHVYMP
jgi:hypothetical protein